MGKQGDEQRSAKLDLTREAFALRNRRGGMRAGLTTYGELRHKLQLDNIAKSGIDPAESILLRSKFERGMYQPSGSNELKYCCLFNLIVAFEWNPGYHELEQLRMACDEAANLLFDATDGFMTFNQVIVGGPELLQCADIQIFASNRLFPRAWVNGLHIEEKYQPIRIGRGYWRKQERRADPWHKNLGAAVLVHEWMHYALGLKDHYVKKEGPFALPQLSPSVNTLMANLMSNELHEGDEWRLLSEKREFTWLGIPGDRKPVNIPPDDTPAPRFDLVGTAKADLADEPLVWLQWDAELEAKLVRDHCWVYVLVGENGAFPLDRPGQLIAQGSYEALPEGYRIIGAREGAIVILIGRSPDEPSQPTVLYRKVAGFSGSTIRFADSEWKDGTPEGPTPLPLIAVKTSEKRPPYKLSWENTDTSGRDWTETLFPLGELRPSNSLKVGVLDGHMLLTSRSSMEKPYQLVIVNYSIGGSPGAAFPGSPNPVPAGSSDGNALVFFHDEEVVKQRLAESTNMSPINSLRIVTTTNLLGPMENLHQHPRSYVFGLMPNGLLPVDSNGDPQFLPTLVLFYDTDTLRDAPSGTRLSIHRLHQGSWVELDPAYQTQSPDRLLVAAQLNRATAPGLFPGDPRQQGAAKPPTPEYYRLFLVPADEQLKAAIDKEWPRS